MRRLLVLSFAVAIAAACSERLPQVLGDLGLAPPANGPGLDARPASPSCNGRPGGGVVDAKISFAEASPVELDEPVAVAVNANLCGVVVPGGPEESALVSDFVRGLPSCW